MKTSYTFLLTLLLYAATSLLFYGCGMGVSCSESGEGCWGIASVGSASGITNSDGSVTVTVTGSGFVSGDTVTVNGTRCNNVRVQSLTQLTCTLPSKDIPITNIVVTNPGGGNGGSGGTLSSPIFSSTAASVTSVAGAFNWTNLPDAMNTDGLFASVAFSSSGDTSQRLLLKGYFTGSNYVLPNTAKIDGIKVNCNWFSVVELYETITEHEIYLLKSGLVAGANKATGASLPRDAFTPLTSPQLSEDFGGSADTWGVSGWQPSDINASDFGLAVSLTNDAFFGAHGIAYIDNCQIAVYWH